MEYVDAIDHLLGFVGSDVLVRVGNAEHHVGFVLMHGVLGQGEREGFGGDDVSYFSVGEPSQGLYIDRRDFERASYDAETETLTIWHGGVVISVEPHVTASGYQSPEIG